MSPAAPSTELSTGLSNGTEKIYIILFFVVQIPDVYEVVLTLHYITLHYVA
jgi:hypothetical protein